MSESTPTEVTHNPESSLETKHNNAIQKLLTRSAQITEQYIDTRVKDNKLFLKDMNLVAGGLLIGLGIWQALAGGDIPNVFEHINIFHLPYYNEMGQIITDTQADVKIVGGLSTAINTIDSYKPRPPHPGKIDYYLVKAYAKDYLSRIGFGRRKHE